MTSCISPRMLLRVRTALYMHMDDQHIYAKRIKDTPKGGAYVLQEIESLCQSDKSLLDASHLQHILMSTIEWLWGTNLEEKPNSNTVLLRKKRLNDLFFQYLIPQEVRAVNRIIHDTYNALKRTKKNVYYMNLRAESGLYQQRGTPPPEKDSVFLESGIQDIAPITDAVERKKILGAIIRNTSPKKREPFDYYPPALPTVIQRDLKKLLKLLSKHDSLSDVKKAWHKKKISRKSKIILRDLFRDLYSINDIVQWRAHISKLLEGWNNSGHPLTNHFTRDELRARCIVAILKDVNDGELTEAFRNNKHKELKKKTLGKQHREQYSVPLSTARNQAAAVRREIKKLNNSLVRQAS